MSYRWCSDIRTYVQTKSVHLIYIGANTYKYIDHETTNWLGCGGRRSEHCRSGGGGIVETMALDVIVTRSSPYDGDGVPHSMNLTHV